MKAKSKNGLITLLPLIALGALQVWYQSLTHVLIIYTVILLAYQSGDINGRSTKGDVPFYNILIPLAGVAVLLVQQQTIQLLICISMAIIQNQCQFVGNHNSGLTFQFIRNQLPEVTQHFANDLWTHI